MEIILHKWFGFIVTLNSYFVNRNLVHFKIFFTGFYPGEMRLHANRCCKPAPQHYAQ